MDETFARRVRLGRKLILASAVWLLLGSGSRAAQHTFPIQTDAYMDSQSASLNLGTATTVKALINSSDGSICRGLFQLPPEVGLYDKDRIARATVCFYVFSDQTAGRNVTLFPLTRPFVEGTGNGDGATWNTYDGTNAWASAGGEFDTNYPVVGVRGTDGYFRWDIAPLLRNEAARTNLLACGALLRIDEAPVPPSGTPRAPFTSSDSANAEKPYVQVTMAARVVLAITNDAYVDSRSSNTGRNYGAATTVKTVVNSSDGSVCRGLLMLPPELDLYPTDQLARASVLLYMWQDNTTNRNVTLYPLTRSFVEGTGNGASPADGATWQTCDGTNAWTTPGGDCDTNFPIVGVKEPILNIAANDRFISWDITPLLTNAQARSELMNYGAMLQIDEAPLPPSGMPRAPLTSSDDLAYTAEFRPHVLLLVVPQIALQASVEGDTIALAATHCAPFVTNRIERSFDLLQPDGWTLVTNLVTTGFATNWAELIPPEWTNAYYRITSCQ